jgi:phosphatidylserine decarboxylase
MDTVTQFRDRETGRIETERIIGQRGLEMLYRTAVGRWLTNAVLRREPVSRCYGWLQRRPRSRRGIKRFVDNLGIDTGELEKPLEAYCSLDDFFTRKLRPEVRPVDENADHLVSPADGRVLVYPNVSDGELVVKQCRVKLDELLGDVALAARFRDGTVVIVRLSPADYHRFHFSDGGQASPTRWIGRGLHSVHPIALTAGAASFYNKRTITRLESHNFGPLLLIDVGALFVGDIIQTYQPGHVERGQEKGYFRFGGSTVVIVAQPGRVRLDDDLIESSQTGLETYVRMGTRIGCRCGR